MHVFTEYGRQEAAWIWRLVDENPFALLITTGDGVPRATHVPVLWAPTADRQGPVEGATVLGHLAAVNEQTRDLAAEDATAMLAVSGPHAYVSPSTYQAEQAAPTWNYAAVHLTGAVRVLDADESLDVIHRTVQHLESSREEPWDPSGSLAYWRRILPGVRAFAMTVTSVSAQFKLSQDKPADVRARVRADVGDDVARWMERTDPDRALVGAPWEGRR
ncbi:FMN-binding negative transcriptional regulator [Kineosporia sp. J2-2]|uniref:FMN-binding negative transcriptional regulator n=1 Tax=Kineosporia corallincola TaxID=2835133 RepID=A0ABS5TI03_9ACTN|nr:FMN-binding negative transcriptional regulator [Kineosporia corallincola]MBT0770731.1 FMN-binding negative transcriptional regulator [Kineosporia corallincola]